MRDLRMIPYGSKPVPKDNREERELQIFSFRIAKELKSLKEQIAELAELRVQYHSVDFIEQEKIACEIVKLTNRLFKAAGIKVTISCQQECSIVLTEG